MLGVSKQRPVSGMDFYLQVAWKCSEWSSSGFAAFSLILGLNSICVEHGERKTQDETGGFH